MSLAESVREKANSMTTDDYFALSEERKTVTPENIGGLIEYPAKFKAMQEDRDMRPALSEPMSTGRAFSDFMAMPTDRFMSSYVIADGPINPKTGKPFGADTKAFIEWRATQEKVPVATWQLSMFVKMTEAYKNHAFVKSLEGFELIPNVVVTATVCGVPCACKIDRLYVSDRAVFAVDVKTTDDLYALRYTCDRLHYREQQSLILHVLSESGLLPDTGVAIESRIAAIEKGKMPRCGVFGVAKIDEVSQRLEETLEDYAESCRTGSFGTRFEAPQVI